MNITNILAELKSKRRRVERAIAAITALNSTGRRRGSRTRVTSAPKRRLRRLSAAARAKLSRLMKQRWARGKMKTRQLKATKPARRGMSRAARNRIAAAQRARWAKVKTQQAQKKTA